MATTPEQAFEKYRESKVQWTFSSDAACSLVLDAFNEKKESEKKNLKNFFRNHTAASMHGSFFENLVEAKLLNEGKEVETKVLAENEGADTDQKRILETELKNVARHNEFVLPRFKEVQRPRISLIEELRNLTDPDVLYRLPKNFPLINFFNPPNNCFSANVGDRHPINLNQAVKLCKEGVDPKQQVNFVHICPSDTFKNMTRWQSFTLQEIVDRKAKFSQKALCQLPVDNIRTLARMVQFCLRFKNY